MAVVITWPPNPEPDVDHYTVFKSDNKTVSGPYTPLGTVPHDPDAVELTFTDPVGAEDDEYKLEAVNTGGIPSLATNAFLPIKAGDLTRLYDTIMDAGLHPVVGITVEAKLDAPQATFNGVVVPRTVKVLTDSNGIWVLDLFPNSALLPAGTKYLITIQNVRTPKLITLPATEVARYTDLITLP